MGIMFQKRKMPNKDNGFSIKRKLRVMKHEYIKFCIAQSLGNGSFISERVREEEILFLLSLPQCDSLDNLLHCQ